MITTAAAVLGHVASTLPIRRPPRIMFSQGFWRLGQAGQQLYDVLWVATGFGSYPIKIRDWELAKLCGRGLRWVQKALKQLADRTRDNVADPIIGRFRVYGHKEDSGRCIEIIDKDALPDPKPDPKPKGPAKEAPPKAPAPTRSEPEPVDESPEAIAAALERMKAEIARSKAGRDADRARPGTLIAAVPEPPKDDLVRRNLEKQIAGLETIPAGQHVPWMVAELARLKERLAALHAAPTDPPARE
jgi:hypothetical protein